MMAIKHGSIIALTLAVVVTLAGCGPKGEQLYARAEKSLAAGDSRYAVIDLKSLLQDEPQNASARTLLGTRLVDSGSGYNTQDAMPVHFGLPTLEPIEIEVTWPANGRRVTPLTRIVSPQISRVVTIVVVK